MEGISIGILIYCLLFCIIVSSASLKVGTISSKACAYSYAFLFMRVSMNDSVNCQAEIETHVQPWFLSLRIVTLIYLFILIGQLNTLKS